MYIILLVYAVDGFLFVVSDATKSINKQVTPLDRDETPGFAPAKFGFMD